MDQVSAGVHQLRIKRFVNVYFIDAGNDGEWVLLDYGDFVVHIFEKEARDFYDLQRLWRDAKKVEMPKDI